MRLSLFVCVLLFPLLAWAYSSVIARPDGASVILLIENPETAQEFFGRLDDFPHTFEFRTNSAFPFKAALSIPDSAEQKSDVSVILVKKERRGVSEIGRTRIKDQSWESREDAMLVRTFKSGGTLEAELEPGVYTLEVSSPNNDGKYRLVLGTEEIDRGYFEDLRVLFEVTTFLDHSKFSTIRSPLMYWPIFILLTSVILVYLYRRKKTSNGV